MPLSQTRVVAWTAGLLLAVCGSMTHAAGLGPISVQSGFGETLRATIPLFGSDTDSHEADCVRARVEAVDGSFIFTPRVGVARGKDGNVIHITTSQFVNELALTITIGLGCTTPVQRVYQILLDPVVALPEVARDEEARNSRTNQKRQREAIAAESAVAPVGESSRPRRDRPRYRTAENVVAKTATADAAVEPPAPKTNKPRKKSAPAAEHSVLKLSGVDSELVASFSPDGLRMSDTLSVRSIDNDPQRMEDLKAAQAKFAALLRDEDPAKSVKDELQAAKTQIEALKAETEKLRQQSRTDKAAVQSANEEASGWLVGLKVLLGLALIAIGWLLWRFYIIKRREASRSWNELLGEDDVRSSFMTSRLGRHSEFNTSQFGDTDFGDTGFGDSEFHTTSINTMSMDTPTFNSIVDENTHPDVDTRADAPQPSESAQTRRPGLKRFRKKPKQALKAEEISDVMELAEAWMALQNPAKVLEILEPFNDVEQPESPLPWLCLLDVYRSLGDRQKYEAILERITKIFNVRLSPWENVEAAEPPKTLADFPHVIDNVVRLWGSDEVLAYLENLMLDDRNGARNGFDLPAYRDIIKLLDMAADPAGPGTGAEVARIIEESASARRLAEAHAAVTAVEEETREEQEAAAPPAEAEPASTSTSTQRKPQLRERPKYITTSYHRKLAKPNVSESSGEALPQIAMPAGEEAAGDKKTDGTPDYDDMSPMAIKLHLAIAYQDIGDRDGALLLLEEVVDGGTPEQVEQAKALLMKLK